MMDIMFFVKTFLLTIAIVLLMQLQIGSKSIEGHAMGFVQSSAIVSPLNGVAQGAAKLIRDVSSSISSRIKKTEKKSRREEAQAPSYDGQD